jgi:hypothetical protein
MAGLPITLSVFVALALDPSLDPSLEQGAVRAPTPPIDAHGVRVVFEWDAPAGLCPDGEFVQDELERLLGGPLEAERGRRLTAIARVREESDGQLDLRLWTVLEEGTRHRSIRSDDCEVLGKAAALLTAIAIDPEVMSRSARADVVGVAESATELDPGVQLSADEPIPAGSRAPALVPAGSHAPALAPASASAPVGAEARSKDSNLGFTIGAAVGGSHGALPAFGPQLELAGALVASRRSSFAVRVQVAGGYAFERSARFTDRPDQGANMSLAYGGIRACPTWSRRRVDVPLCGGVEAGAILGRGVGLAEPRSDRVLWLALTVGSGAEFRLGKYGFLGLGLEGQVPLARSEFEIEGVGVVWRPPPVGVKAFALGGVRF